MIVASASRRGSPGLLRSTVAERKRRPRPLAVVALVLAVSGCRKSPSREASVPPAPPVVLPAADAAPPDSGDRATVSWAGPSSGLPYYDGVFSDARSLEALRRDPSTGRTRPFDAVECFQAEGTYRDMRGAYDCGARVQAGQYRAVVLSVMAFPGGRQDPSSARGRSIWPRLGPVPAPTWPERLTPDMDDRFWVSVTWPVGYSADADYRSNALRALEVWSRASVGYFDAMWTSVLGSIRSTLGDLSRVRVIVRTNWEGNKMPAELFSTAKSRVDKYMANNWVIEALAPSERAVLRAGMDRFGAVAKQVFAGSEGTYVHLCPLSRQAGKIALDDFVPPGVDILGPDYYDTAPIPRSDEEFDKALHATTSVTIDGERRENPLGIGAWRRFARRHGKLFGVGEMGVMTCTDGEYACGGDNPVFIRNVLRFLRLPADEALAPVAYAVYFNKNTHTSMKHRLAPAGQSGEPRDDATFYHPRASEAYRRELAPPPP